MESVHDATRDELTKARLQAHVPTHVEGAGGTAQVEEDPWTPDDSLRPPVDLEYLAMLTLISPMRRSCIAAIALNTVGLGFRLDPREGEEEEAGAAVDVAEAARRLDALSRQDVRLARPSFTRQLSAVQWDRQEVGQGYLEVSRNQTTGEIDGLYHVPGKRIRRRSDRKGWVMGPKGGRGTELIHFYDFGDKVQYDESGRPTATLQQYKRWDRNELVVFRHYTSASRDYGLPPDAQLAVDYLGDKLAAKSNVDYFDHSGVPPSVIFVQGREADPDGTGEIEVEVDQTAVEAIANTMKGGGAQARVALIPIPAGTVVQKEDLSFLTDRDLGFVSYRADNRRRVLGAWRLSPIFVADIEDAGRYTAEVERAISKEQVFDPEQIEVGDVLDQTLLNELFPELSIHFNEIEINTDETKRASANDLADRGKITNGEYRDAHGYPPLPEREPGEQDPTEDEDGDGQPDGKVPHGWNAQLVDDKAAALTPPELGPFAAAAARGEDPETFAKRHGAVGALSGEIEDELDRIVDDAVRSVSLMADDAELRPVVIERTEDGRVLVRPHTNGSGA